MIRHRTSIQRLTGWCIGLTAAFAAAWVIEAASPWRLSRDGRGSRDATSASETAPPQSASAANSSREVDVPIRLNHFSTPWSKVLTELAEQSGSTLVMDEAPPGRFRRRDRNDYTRSEAVRILNEEMEPMGFRLVEQGNFLLVLNRHKLRTRYKRPVIPRPPGAELESASKTPQTDKAPWEHGFGAASSPAPKTPAEPHASPPRPLPQRAGNSIRLASHETDAVEPVLQDHETLTQEAPAAGPETTGERVQTLRLRHRAVDVARILYDAFQPSAELLQQGPNGLPAFVVYRSEDVVPQRSGHLLLEQALQREPQFSIGIDSNRNELVLAAAAAAVEPLTALIGSVDAFTGHEMPVVRPLADVHHRQEVLRVVPALLERLASGANARRPSGQVEQTVALRLAQQIRQNDPRTQQQPQQPPNNGRPAVAPTPFEEGPVLRIDGIKGPVTVQEVPGVGLVVTGNKDDVDAVIRIIRELDRVGRGTTPDIHLLLLRHVNSEALAALLTSVYTELETIRRGVADQRKNVSVIPVVKPNAVLILAPQAELQSVLKLAEELDQPVDPQSELHVFGLRHAVASQVVTALESFYAERAGLGARVTAVADARTNSVVVQARPRDLAEVAAMIRQIDRDQSGAVSRMRVFVLKNAVAEELAEVINQSIQSVLNPPQVTGIGQQQLAVGAQAAQELRDVKSVVLEFLAGEGAGEQFVRSGILADIRVTADARTNSLLVTAPEQSMPLMEALIRQLDQPTETVAEIKVFTLANSDATRMIELLQALFEPETGQEQLGIQVAGAADVSSSLIPLRFSVDVRTNSLIAVGGADALRVVEAILLRLDEGDVRQRKTEVIRLKNSPVVDVAAAINAFLQSQRDLALLDPDLVSNIELLEREIIAVPEPVSNSLLISVTPRYYEEIKRLVEKLDEAPPQVIIQALLVEVELDNTDEFGVELGFQDSLLFDRSVVTNLVTLTETNTSPNGVQTTTQNVISQESTPGFLFNNQQLGNNTAIMPASVGTQGLSNFSLGRINGDLGFGGLVLSASSESVSVLVRALAARRNVQVLSRPQIRTLDNQLAQIQVGQQVPIVNGVTTVGTVGSIIPLIEQDEAGIILTVTPRISPDGTIVMETVAEKSAFQGDGVPLFTDITTGVTITSPIKDITTARTTVAVPNGQTIVLGGMITKGDDTFERKVPYFGNIPVLGHLFRYDSTNSRRTELLIFLTPRIVRNDADSEVINQVEIERMHFFEEDAEEIHGPIYAVPPESEVQPKTDSPAPHPVEMLPAPSLSLPYDDPNVPTTIVPQGRLLLPEGTDGGDVQTIPTVPAAVDPSTGSALQPTSGSRADTGQTKTKKEKGRLEWLINPFGIWAL